ncbi:NET1-associated nuclear protein 1 [Mucor velutinosus]|uniref:NET1-associated nuclear protein 1 n=1 Tax=Mucor velutinosus TaxID=708070 RepID=A0AAN7I4A1_9FUNG|nr:NET1-associated nuclear protein 1 [Mucor velutinosus]
MENQKTPHCSSEHLKSPAKGILQKSHDYEQHETPEHKIKWDENKLKATEKQQKEQVLMKVDEPNTPYIRYDPVADKVTNWEALPESLRAAHEEPEDFMLDGGGVDKAPDTPRKSGIAFANEPDEWQKIDEKEKRDKEQAARKRHEEFERKRAQHYYHAGDVLHKNLQEDEDDSVADNKTSNC